MNTIIQTFKPVYLISAEIGSGAQLVECQAGANLIAESIYEKYKHKINIEEKIRVIENNNIQKKIDCVVEFAPRLADQVSYALLKNGFPIILGGDHSCAIGTWSAVASYYLQAAKHNICFEKDKMELEPVVHQRSKIGLIWIDAHLDSHTPDTSPSHAPHGMSLAALLGFGHTSLTHLYSGQPKINPENIAIIGARSFEIEETELLKQLGVKIFYMKEVVARGFHDCFLDAQKWVKRNTDHYGISFDLDVIDPKFAPGVGSPEPDGIHTEEVILAFKSLKADQHFCAFELVELNPFLDKDNKTLNLGLSIIQSIFD